MHAQNVIYLFLAALFLAFILYIGKTFYTQMTKSMSASAVREEDIEAKQK
ncbi:hypothetical protein [Bacillus sp. 1P06AnD]